MRERSNGTGKVYVGNLPYSTTDADLSDLFSEAGKVKSARIITDRETGRSKGFAFVEFTNADDAEEAIRQFHEYDLDGRRLKVNAAQEKSNR